MEEQENAHLADPGLLAAWLAARSIARGLAPPVPDHGGWRVETGLPGEIRRYVFSGPVAAISTLAASIHRPHILIKMCGTGEQLLRLLPPRWQLLPGGFFMTHEGSLPAPSLPAGYRLVVATSQAITTARILTGDGSVAASGHAVEHAGAFVFDRIVTEAAHRRQGLGRALIAALAARQRSGSARRVLVATEDGLKLYASLGWHTRSPYSTAAII
ncbi:GNAT family N-acetyltransferase [Janthinobacterium sp. PAMC25594]|uniref:GNAT family N-acetyltransferase n=1 Tax=Janthinobacterium sp. PAMC25594 TaxID=2861284 RepID=UPI001C62B9E0|nr:GNAT family N-acetyltransferase [Janthinobacterium sp. PAMC25594]QYG06766.1 GNAT family N-acetyltransferase [Janthinobacterium sp. PAMC25594]